MPLSPEEQERNRRKSAKWYKNHLEAERKRGRDAYRKIGRKEKMRDRQLRACFDITLAEYERLLVAQHYKCAICKSPPGNRQLHVDHDHKLKGRKAVRGLLCNRCNNARVATLEDPLLPKIVRYLKNPPARAILKTITDAKLAKLENDDVYDGDRP